MTTKLSVASIRARLRNLDQMQIRQFIEYEQAHAGMAGFNAISERRPHKLETESGWYKYHLSTALTSAEAGVGRFCQLPMVR